MRNLRKLGDTLRKHQRFPTFRQKVNIPCVRPKERSDLEKLSSDLEMFFSIPQVSSGLIRGLERPLSCTVYGHVASCHTSDVYQSSTELPKLELLLSGFLSWKSSDIGNSGKKRSEVPNSELKGASRVFLTLLGRGVQKSECSTQL